MPGSDVQVIVPNLKKRWSGVTSTVFRLVPIQRRDINLACVGPALPQDLPQMTYAQLVALPGGPRRVWHARRNNEMAAGLLMKRLFGKNLALMFTSAAQREHSKYTRWLIRQMDRVVATSDKSASFLEKPAEVIMHGIDCQRFRPEEDKPAAKEALGLDPSRRYVGCFGRVRHQKGVDLFVDMMIALAADFPDVDGLIAGGTTGGNTDYVDDLKRRIAEAGLADRIHFLGERPDEDLPKLFRILDAYVAPQRWEGFGLTPIEAMASGVPVVASHAGAFEEMVEDGVNGYLTPTGDLDALRTALRRLLADPQATAQMGAQARDSVLANFNIETEAQRLVAIYRELLASEPR